MCYITATELKENLSKYLELSQTEDVYVTKNNKVITKLTNPKKDSLQRLLALKGVLGEMPKNKTYKDVIGEAIIEHETIRWY